MKFPAFRGEAVFDAWRDFVVALALEEACFREFLEPGGERAAACVVQAVFDFLVSGGFQQGDGADGLDREFPAEEVEYAAGPADTVRETGFFRVGHGFDLLKLLHSFGLDSLSTSIIKVKP